MTRDDYLALDEDARMAARLQSLARVAAVHRAVMPPDDPGQTVPVGSDNRGEDPKTPLRGFGEKTAFGSWNRAHPPLSAVEQAIIAKVQAGRDVTEIAGETSLSEVEVVQSLRAILGKLAANPLDAVRTALQEGEQGD